MDRAFGDILNSSVDIFFTFIYMLIIVRVILSWVPIDTRSNPLLAIIYAATDPILYPLRRMLQKSPLGGRGMMLDFSPLFALFLLQLVKSFVSYLIMMLIGM